MSYLGEISALWRAHNTAAQGTMTVGETFNLEFIEGASLNGDDVLVQKSVVYADSRLTTTASGVQFGTELNGNTSLRSGGFHEGFASSTTAAAITQEDGTYGVVSQRCSMYLTNYNTSVPGTGASPDETRFFGVRLSP